MLKFSSNVGSSFSKMSRNISPFKLPSIMWRFIFDYLQWKRGIFTANLLQNCMHSLSDRDRKNWILFITASSVMNLKKPTYFLVAEFESVIKNRGSYLRFQSYPLPLQGGGWRTSFLHSCISLMEQVNFETGHFL